jgi:hypothetical protein
MQKPLGPLARGALLGHDMRLRPACLTPEPRSRVQRTDAHRRERAGNASGEFATRIPPPREERQRHLPCFHREPAGLPIMTRPLLRGLRLRGPLGWWFEKRVDRYPGANRVVHHWGRENGGGESFGLSCPISWQFTPNALGSASAPGRRAEPSLHSRPLVIATSASAVAGLDSSPGGRLDPRRLTGVRLARSPVPHVVPALLAAR